MSRYMKVIKAPCEVSLSLVSSKHTSSLSISQIFLQPFDIFYDFSELNYGKISQDR